MSYEPIFDESAAPDDLKNGEGDDRAGAQETPLLDWSKCWRCGGVGSYSVLRIADGRQYSAVKVCPSCH